MAIINLSVIMFFILLSGFLGGAIRGVVGLIKHRLSYKEVPFRWKYFLGMVLVSGLIGFTVVAVVKDLGFTLQSMFSWSLALLIGYAGGDFLENMYKIILQKGELKRPSSSGNKDQPS